MRVRRKLNTALRHAARRINTLPAHHKRMAIPNRDTQTVGLMQTQPFIRRRIQDEQAGRTAKI
jgi:hypothetical protein